MSVRSEYLMSLARMELSGKTEEKLLSFCNQLLNSGMHGLCFSPSKGSQEPMEPEKH